MEERQTQEHNYMYSKLVENQDDILGILAYSIYKRQKIEYIQTKRTAKGRELTDDDLEEFFRISNTPSQMQFYRAEAELLADEFLAQALSTELGKVESEQERRYEQRLLLELKGLRCGFWSGVAQSLIGSVVFVLFVGLVVAFAWSLNQGAEQVIEQIFNVEISPRDEWAQRAGRNVMGGMCRNEDIVQKDELLKLVVDALEDVKAMDLRVIDVEGKSGFTDVMVIASGNTARQVKALAENVVMKCKEVGHPALGVEGEREGEWVLVDLGDVVVHVMLPATRDYYNLDRLWGEGSPQAEGAAEAKGKDAQA